MIDLLDSNSFENSSIEAIRKAFELGLPVALSLDDWPNKDVRVWPNGRVEEIVFNETSSKAEVVSILDENYQKVNDLINKVISSGTT